MSRKIPLVCEMCDCMWYVGRFEEESRCPRCGYPCEVELDAYDDRRYEDGL